jgi:aspartyl-tRNA(Asn)/glutamyl-tRNA(Gln) amidotransferase subunit A
MLSVMAGPDPRDPLSTGRPAWDFIAAAAPAGDLAGTRVAWRPRLGNTAVAAAVLTACESAVGALAELGAAVAELTTPFDNPEAVWFVNNGAYRRAQFGHHLERHRAIMCPTFVRQMDRVASYSAAELYEAIFARTRLYRQVQAWFDTADIAAMPTLSRPAPPIDQDFFGPIEIDNQSVENIRAAWYPYTMPFNLTGNPAVSLPCGFDAAGMPLAIQLIAAQERTSACCGWPPCSNRRGHGRTGFQTSDHCFRFDRSKDFIILTTSIYPAIALGCVRWLTGRAAPAAWPSGSA